MELTPTYKTENAYCAFLKDGNESGGISLECRPRPYAVPTHIETEKPTAMTCAESVSGPLCKHPLCETIPMQPR